MEKAIKIEECEELQKNPKKQGFALVEVLITLFILSISMLSINYVQLINHKIAVNLHARGIASALGQRTLDSLEVAGLNSIKSDSFTTTEDNRDFTVVYSISNLDNNQDTTNIYVTAKKVDITVRWQIASDDHSIAMQGVVE